MTLRACCWAGLAVYAALSAVDWMLTFALLETNPEAYEANPVAAVWLERHGWGGLAVFKAAGMVVFVAATLLLVRRRPPVAAGVIGLGCVVLLGVTGYSHQLLAQTESPPPRWSAHERPANPPGTFDRAE